MNNNPLSNSKKKLEAIARKHRCVKCGECCNNPQPIGLTKEDAQRISVHLKLDFSEFKEQYLETTKIKTMRKEFIYQFLETQPCKFLKNKQCSIYEVRPEICKYYPAEFACGGFKRLCLHDIREKGYDIDFSYFAKGKQFSICL
jgi:Fe-S-cluster containining protein